MKAILKIILYISVLLSVFAAGCDEYVTETSDYYSFTVISSGGSISGFYIVDSDPMVTFTTEDKGTGYWETRVNLSSPTAVDIVADSSITATAVYINLYVNSKKVKTVSDSISGTGDTLSAELYYDEFDTTESK